MEMTMQALYVYIGAFVSIVIGILGVKLYKSGADNAKAKSDQEELKKHQNTESIQKKIDAIVKEAEREINAQNIDDVRNRLKSSSVRKPSDKD